MRIPRININCWFIEITPKDNANLEFIKVSMFFDFAFKDLKGRNDLVIWTMCCSQRFQVTVPYNPFAVISELLVLCDISF